MRRSLTAAAAALGALALAAPASAAVYVTTYRGTLSSGLDFFNSFRTGSVDLTGKTASLAFRTDDSVPAADLDLGDTTAFGDVYPSRPVTATLTVDGVTVDLSPNASAFQHQRDTADTGQDPAFAIEMVFHSTHSSAGGSRPSSFRGGAEARLSGVGADFLAGRHWRSLTTAQANAAPEKFASFNYVGDVYDPDTGARTDFRFSGEMDVTSVTVSVTAVPEPATWALMILGFAVAGVALRRRSREARPDPLR